MKKLLIICMACMCAACAWAAKVNAEKTVDVNGQSRKYVLYVPDNAAENAPLVISLHGAAGHDTDRSPFRTSVADAKGCIVAYPQGLDQHFPIFGGSVPGWNATGVANEELDFFKAIIEQVAELHSIDRSRIYCCGFSNGGMMTYANASSASDIFAAFASISGFPLNEFHLRATGTRPMPFLHIHGKADDFVKYSCMPIIRDAMVARNGCDPVPEVKTSPGKYTKSVYKAGQGGFPYVYYEVDGMWHADYTDNTEDGNSALTMWKFMSQYSLGDPCDKSLKWRLNIDADGFDPAQHCWKVNADKTRFSYGTPQKPNNIDNNVYPSLQLEPGCYALRLESSGDAANKIYVQVETLDGKETVFCKSASVGAKAVMPFSIPAYAQCKITIVKESADDKLTDFAIFLEDGEPQAVNSQDDELPEESIAPETGSLVEIPQDQGKDYDDFARTPVEQYDGYTLYTASDNLQIAFKMMNVDVKDCDYVVVKFAEPVEAGWHLAFWSGTELVDVPAGAEEYKFELEQSMVNSGILPQICLMTFFGGFTAPLQAKVAGVYKHCVLGAPDALAAPSIADAPAAYYSLNGLRQASPRGLTIARMADGTARKVLMR